MSKAIYQDWDADRHQNDFTNMATLLDALDAIGRDSVNVGESVASVARTAAYTLVGLSHGDEEMSVDFQ